MPHQSSHNGVIVVLAPLPTEARATLIRYRLKKKKKTSAPMEPTKRSSTPDAGPTVVVAPKRSSTPEAAPKRSSTPDAGPTVVVAPKRSSTPDTGPAVVVASAVLPVVTEGPAERPRCIFNKEHGLGSLSVEADYLSLKNIKKLAHTEASKGLHH
ncbi:hypothetical protein PGT21_016485 [Puccinia graminis f. sp. tritici]|uniref:Uncharacterized protein n=1 Tax=Puccinia graminis f. sp. tritici TaxID=56615 RepID=A0A5B0PKL3_PUCGR|nr:hypothetical protein PGT21_016485 [Puccinia graminis f. sp. tritici]